MTEGTSSKDEMIQWKKAMKDPLNPEDFDFDEDTPDEGEDDDPLGLKKNTRNKGERGRTGREEGKVGRRKPGHPVQASN